MWIEETYHFWSAFQLNFLVWWLKQSIVFSLLYQLVFHCFCLAGSMHPYSMATSSVLHRTIANHILLQNVGVSAIVHYCVLNKIIKPINYTYKKALKKNTKTMKWIDLRPSTFSTFHFCLEN